MALLPSHEGQLPQPPPCREDVRAHSVSEALVALLSAHLVCGGALPETGRPPRLWSDRRSHASHALCFLAGPVLLCALGLSHKAPELIRSRVTLSVGGSVQLGIYWAPHPYQAVSRSPQIHDYVS